MWLCECHDQLDTYILFTRNWLHVAQIRMQAARIEIDIVNFGVGDTFTLISDYKASRLDSIKRSSMHLLHVWLRVPPVSLKRTNERIPDNCAQTRTISMPVRILHQKQSINCFQSKRAHCRFHMNLSNSLITSKILLN